MNARTQKKAAVEDIPITHFFSCVLLLWRKFFHYIFLCKVEWEEEKSGEEEGEENIKSLLIMSTKWKDGKRKGEWEEPKLFYFFLFLLASLTNRKWVNRKRENSMQCAILKKRVHPANPMFYVVKEKERNVQKIYIKWERKRKEKDRMLLKHIFFLSFLLRLLHTEHLSRMKVVVHNV